MGRFRSVVIPVPVMDVPDSPLFEIMSVIIEMRSIVLCLCSFSSAYAPYL
jgi:hypothetical protein